MPRTELPPSSVRAVLVYEDMVTGHAQMTVLCESQAEFILLQKWVLDHQVGFDGKFFALAKDFPVLSVLDKTMATQ